MRTHNLFSRLGVAMVAILLLSSMQQVYANGTLAGTVISNQASVQYNAGSNVRNASSNVITMTVGYKVSINLVASSSTTTTVDSAIIYKAFYANNTGNYTDDLKLTVGHVPAGWVAQIYHDVNNNQVFDGGDVLIPSGNHLSADTTFANRIPLIVKITIPGGANAADNMSDSVTVYVESDGTGPAGVVRVGGAGRQVYFAYITIAKPVLSVTGAQSPAAPTAGQKIPGSSFTYTLTLQNTGHLAIQNGATLSFKLDNDFNYTGSSNSGSNSGVDGSGNGGTVSWTLNAADLPATSGTITRQVTVTIEQVTATGTGATVGNTIYIMDSTHATTTQLVYNDGLNAYTKGTSPLSSFNVTQASGAFLAITTATQSGNPGDSLTYSFSVRNGGNSAMTFTLSQIQLGGVLDTVHLFTATSGVAGSQPFTTASIPAGNTVTFYVYLIVNVTGQNNNTIIRQLSAAPGTAGTQPLGAGNYNPSITVTTTVTAPSLLINLQQAWISGVGTLANPAPGDTIEYTLTITNSGTGNATSVTTSNAIPSNTTFCPNSYGLGTGIQVDGSAKTNIVDGDLASFSGTTVSAGPFTVGGTGGTKVITYQVVVN